MKQKFYKYQGAGNDFVLIDGRRGGFDPRRELVAALCDRHTGIGADGLMILGTDPREDFRMRYFNADGGESTMCGNGGRCIALFAHHLGIGGLHKTFSGTDGRHEVELLSADGLRGEMVLGMIDVRTVERGAGYYFLDTGSPHYVKFVEDVRTADVFGEGGAIRRSAVFASGGGTNVNFVQLLGDGHIRVRTFERGVEDETLACGTGAVASAIAAAVHGGTSCRNYTVEVEGGTLGVRFNSVENKGFTDVVLQGPAQKVFEGEIELNF